MTYSFSYLEPDCCSMSSSNCCFLTCIQVSQEAGQVVWYSHLFQNFPQLIVIHTVTRAEQSPFLPLEMRSDSSGASKMQPRDLCRPWRGTLGPGHKLRPALGFRGQMLLCACLTRPAYSCPEQVAKDGVHFWPGIKRDNLRGALAPGTLCSFLRSQGPLLTHTNSVHN